MSSPNKVNNRSAAGRYSWCDFIVRRLISARIPLIILGHLIVFILVYRFAFLLRFDFSVPESQHFIVDQSLPIVVAIKLIIFYIFGHFHGWWRYVTFADLKMLLKAASISTAIIIAIDHLILPNQIPRSIVLLDWGLTILTIGALRSFVRAAREQTIWTGNGHKISRTLIIGTCYKSSRLADVIRSHPEWHHQVVGLIASKGESNYKRRGSTPVVGSLDDIGKIATKHKVTNILLQNGLIPGTVLRKLMDDCQSAGLSLKIVPDLKDQLYGSAKIPMRDIEINDLLRRDPVELDRTSIAHLVEGKTVLVTGAGGSIGSELCRQIIQYKPNSIILLGRGENRIYSIDIELRALQTDTVIQARIANITDAVRMREVYNTYHPDIVFHAAAHKHVPLMEENPAEAIQNNVVGTKIVADLADEFEVECFVFISTDKAVNPTSVMGFTKQLGEHYVVALASESSTRFIVTRFGNVLASNGSVVPLFKEQIRNGGPITVTDERMTRFFMTIPEASQLVLQAAAIGQDGQIIVLDMGEQIRVIDMARDLIRLAGLPEDAIEIEITGPRPGEKLYEELFDDRETSIPMSHPKLRAAKCQPRALADVTSQIRSLMELQNSHETLHQIIQKSNPSRISDDLVKVELSATTTSGPAPSIINSFPGE